MGETAHAMEPTTEALRDRIMRAVLALADADAEDDRAYHAAWERLRLAVEPWLLPPDQTRRALKAVSKEGLRHGFEAFVALQEPLGTAELAERLGICHRTAQELVEAMKAAALPLRSVRCQNGRKIRYRLMGPRPQGKKPGPVVIQLALWTE